MSELTPPQFHPTAIVDGHAQIGAGCYIGPFCVVGPSVELGERCQLQAHVVLDGPTVIGPDNVFYSFSSIGQRTQDLKYTGEPTHLEIGSGNTFREFVTINRGTAAGAENVYYTVGTAGSPSFTDVNATSAGGTPPATSAVTNSGAYLPQPACWSWCALKPAPPGILKLIFSLNSTTGPPISAAIQRAKAPLLITCSNSA